MGRVRLATCVVAAGLVAAAFAAALRAAPAESAAGSPGTICRTLCEGTPFATPCYVVSSGKDGPTVLVAAGFHGNEPAGAAAADDIRRWKIARGRLVVIPKANKPALDARTRSMPKDVAPAIEGNLNRDFPSDPAQPIKGPLAQAIWAVVQEMKPDWVIDLHEGTGFSAAGARTVGSSIIHSGTEKARTMAERMCQVVNETITEADKKFVLKKLPVEGSLARAAADRRGIPAMILETSRGSQPLALRARQHRLMVHRLLQELGMAAGDVDEGPRSAAGKVRTAIYDGSGARPRAGLETKLAADGDIETEWIGAGQIQDGSLGRFDVLLVPGGSGSAEAMALGKEGCEAVRTFVGQGGGYVGICAGAYLASTGYSWSLGIINARAADGVRGKDTVKVELLPEGAGILGTKPGPVNVNYVNGPILVSAGASDLPPIVILAVFRTEVVSPKREPNIQMEGSPAIVAAPYRKGRVVCISPHPEGTPGLEGLVRAAVRWAAGRKE